MTVTTQKWLAIGAALLFVGAFVAANVQRFQAALG